MAHPIVADEQYVVSLYCNLAGQVAVNRQRIKITSVVGVATTDQDVCDDLRTTWAPLFNALQTSATRFDGVTLRMVAGGVPFPVTKFAATNIGLGTLAPPNLPKQTSGLISLHTEFIGRKYRGRMYVPFPAAISQNLVTGEPIAAYITALQGMGNELIAEHTTGGGGNVVKFRYGLFPVGAVDFAEYKVYLTAQAWATQKRRGDFGQLNRTPF